MEKREDIGQLRLQKTLYLLYAYYGATYGQLDTENGQDSEVEVDYPDELFDASFEAWKYGPVIYSVYKKDKENYYDDNLEKLPKFEINKNYEKDVLLFIDELLDQINEMSDFTLVDRTHQDNSWKVPYNKNKGQYAIPMSNSEIIDEYVKEYVS
ncbi:MAG: DUF4065 domain-containing protein [Tetragenococcus koreensis]|nr:DUF4065 domain-containing protein [Tetragenococcus koreensis]